MLLATSLESLTQAEVTAANAQRFDTSPTREYLEDETQTQSSASDIDEYALQYRRNEVLYAGKPGSLFEFQTDWERKRLVKGIVKFDRALDLVANADNNVRADWQARGIWVEEWGAAWPPESNPMSNYWRWDEKHYKLGPSVKGDWNRARSRMSRAARGRLTTLYTNTSAQNTHLLDIQAALAEDYTDFTRPFRQFCWQVAREAVSELDESVQDVSVVWERVERQWRDAKLWPEEWGSRPGSRWLYEEKLSLTLPE